MLVALACVDKGEKAEGEGRGGQVENGAAGASIGGSSTSIGGSSTNSGGAHASSGGAGAAIGGAGGQRLVDCDLRKVMCRAAQPSCAENQVPSVEGSCFGPCVPIESCACSASLDCPFSDRYTCWQRTHCGPYVR
ncbi:MAG TPA: hypothetical protein VER12_00725 [Polyangiaceae bacterium]|nr:hypothetical protein [Polyangiaceae bacterium]